MTSAASRAVLGDPPVSVWEQPFRQLTPQTRIHAVVAIGDATDAAVSTTRDAVLSLMTDSITLVAEETGLAQRNAVGEGIEHFGYIDGRSQPLFITEDVTQRAEQHRRHRRLEPDAASPRSCCPIQPPPIRPCTSAATSSSASSSRTSGGSGSPNTISR